MSFASTLPQRGGCQRLLLFSEQSGSLLDVPPSALAAFDPGREAEERVPVTSGGSRPSGRSVPFGGLLFRADLAAAWRAMRRAECPVMAIAIGYRSERGGVHAVHLDPCVPGGDSPEGPAVFGRMAAEGVALESRKFFAARWVSGDLLSGVPWLDETAVLLDDAAKGLPYIDRAALDATDLQTDYEAPGAMLPGPPGYRGPVWATEDGVDIGPAGFVTGLPVSRIVLPIPAPRLVLRLDVPGAGTSEVQACSLSFYDRDGADLGGGIADLSAAGSSAGCQTALPEGTWYVMAEVSGGLAQAPRLTVVSAGPALGVVRISGTPCVSAPVVAPTPPLSSLPPVILPPHTQPAGAPVLTAEATGSDVALSADGDAGEHYVEFYRASVVDEVVGEYVLIATVAADANGDADYDDLGLDDGTYSYKARTLRSGVPSAFSAPVEVEVGAGGGTVEAVRFHPGAVTTNGGIVRYFEIGPNGGSPWALQNATASQSAQGTPASALVDDTGAWDFVSLPAHWRAELVTPADVAEGDVLAYTMKQQNGSYNWKAGYIALELSGGSEVYVSLESDAQGPTTPTIQTGTTTVGPLSGGDPAPEYRYWRLTFSANNGDASFGGTHTVDFFATPGAYRLGGTPTITTSSAVSSNTGAKTYDENGSSRWVVAVADFPAVITFDFGSAVEVAEYGVGPYANDNGSPTRNWAAWTLEGSDDGSTWTTVDTVSGETWSGNLGQVKRYLTS